MLQLVPEIDMKTATSLGAHSPRNHMLDAKELAVLFGVTIRTLSKMIGAKESTVRTRSSSTGLQPALKELALAYDGLGVIFPAESIPRWMHHPLRSTGGLTPIELSEKHGAQTLRKLVDEMVAGGYS